MMTTRRQEQAEMAGIKRLNEEVLRRVEQLASQVQYEAKRLVEAIDDVTVEVNEGDPPNE